MIKRVSGLLILGLAFAAHSASAAPKAKSCPDYVRPMCRGTISFKTDANGCKRPVCKEAKNETSRQICGTIESVGGSGVAAVMPQYYIKTLKKPVRRYRLEDGEESVGSLMADVGRNMCIWGKDAESHGSSEKIFEVDMIQRKKKMSSKAMESEETDTESAE